MSLAFWTVPAEAVPARQDSDMDHMDGMEAEHAQEGSPNGGLMAGAVTAVLFVAGAGLLFYLAGRVPEEDGPEAGRGRAAGPSERE